MMDFSHLLTAIAFQRFCLRAYPLYLASKAFLSCFFFTIRSAHSLSPTPLFLNDQNRPKFQSTDIEHGQIYPTAFKHLCSPFLSVTFVPPLLPDTFSEISFSDLVFSSIKESENCISYSIPVIYFSSVSLEIEKHFHHFFHIKPGVSLIIFIRHSIKLNHFISYFPFRGKQLLSRMILNMEIWNIAISTSI